SRGADRRRAGGPIDGDGLDSDETGHPASNDQARTARPAQHFGDRASGRSRGRRHHSGQSVHDRDFPARTRPSAVARHRAAPHPVLERHVGKHLARVPGATPSAQLGDQQGCRAGRGRACTPCDFGPGPRGGSLARHRRPTSRVRRPALARQSRTAGGHHLDPSGAVMTLQERFAPEHLVATVCAHTGLDDFGDDGWQPALELLVDGLVNEARLSMIGVEVAYGDLMRALSNRLGVIDWRKKNSDVAREKIDRPIFIVGQPRTGTTILYDLLAQDPELRAPLTWEVDEPCPVPQPETYHNDPRIAQIQANIELSEQIVPGFLKYHPMGALVGQECVRITGGEFTSMIYTVQYRLPTYYRWLLYDADHAGAYRYHRKFLQHLQSGVPGQWLLKSPAHLWQLDTLLAEYPDALIVQTHRDPLNVISSIAALTHHLRRMSTDDSTVAECAAQSYEEIIVGLEREM